MNIIVESNQEEFEIRKKFFAWLDNNKTRSVWAWIIENFEPKQVKVEPEVILPKANPQVFTLADLEKAYNDGYKNGIMNEAGLECEPFDVWYNWVHVIKSKNRSEA